MISTTPRAGALVAVTTGAIVLATLGAAGAAGLRFNDTPSMPIGVWRLMTDHAPPRRGEIVAVCPPDTADVRGGAERGYIPAGNCPGGYEPLVKPVAAMAGDVVAISAEGVAVNGQLVKGTVQLAQDTAGRKLRSVLAGVYPVASGEVWLVSGHDPRSFDSRYFGPVPEANVQGVARPIWTFR